MQRQITLNPEASQRASFLIQPTIADNYTVAVDGLTGSFVAQVPLPSAAQLRLPYYARYVNWEWVTAVRGLFAGLSTQGTPKNTWLIVEGEFGSAECEPFVRIAGSDWKVGIGVGQRIKKEVTIDPEYAYEYLINIPEPGKLEYIVTRTSDGAVILEWAGNHGGWSEHSYFSEYSTSLECKFVDGCTSHHEVSHIVYSVYDSKLRAWINATKAYYLDGNREKIAVCEGVTPKATAHVEHYESASLYQDFCEATYG